MLALLLSAVLARRAQAVAVLLLTVLAVGATAAAPWYVFATAEAAAVAHVADAAPAERVLAVRARPGKGELTPVPPERLSASLPIDGGTPTMGIWLAADTRTWLAYRDGVCAKVLVDGACPAAPGEVMIDRETADRQRIRRGDTVSFESEGMDAPAVFTVTGVYRPAAAADPYWTGAVPEAPTGILYTGRSTMDGLRADGFSTTYHLVIPTRAFVRGEVEEFHNRAVETGHLVTSAAPDLAERIFADQRAAETTIVVAVAQLLLLSWFALYLAVRYTDADRRGDVGLLKLRGAARWRLWTMTGMQSVLPVLAGAVLGLGLGLAVGRWLGGPITDPTRVTTALAQTAGGVALAVVGGLIAAVATEWRTVRASVVALLRRVPGRPRRIRADIVDLVLGAVTVFAVYELRTVPGVPRGVASVATTLVALAAGLALARLIPAVAGRIGRRGLYEGHLGTALAGAFVARRPGTPRVYALVVVAVALLATVAPQAYAHDVRQAASTEVELGAARVLTVRADGREHLLTAVRSADPDGRYAMAALRSDGQLAVDAARLPRVASWRSEYGIRPADLAAALRPAAPEPFRLADGSLALDASAAAPGGFRPVVTVHLVSARGEARAVDFVLAPGRSVIRSTVDGCGPPGCRLASISLAVLVDLRGTKVEPLGGTTVSLYGLGPVAFGDQTRVAFGDPTRWRTQVSDSRGGVVLSHRDGALSMTVRDCTACDIQAYAIDAPLPLPAIVAGTPPASAGPRELVLFGQDAVPVEVAAVVPALPRLGTAGTLVDLDYASRVAPRPLGDEIAEVWLSADAPPSLVDTLKAGGLAVLGEQTAAEVRDRYRRQGTASALRFQLLVATAGVLLAVAALWLAAAVDRRTAVAELDALRRQGLPPSTVRTLGYAGYGLVAAACVVVGVVAAVVGEALTPVPAPSDGLALAVVAAAAAVVFGATAVASAARLVAGSWNRRVVMATITFHDRHGGGA